MRIIGTIKNSKTHKPIAGAKIELRIDSDENFVILSDQQGQFKYEVEGKYGILNLSVEKECFIDKSLSYRIDKPELQVNVLLDEIIQKSAFKIDVWVEKGDCRDTNDVLRVQKPGKNYQIGDKINLYFRSEKDCYLFLLNYGTSGKLMVLFPNDLFEDNFIKGNTIYAIPLPREDYPFDYILSGPPGTEKIKAIAATHKFDLADLNFKKEEIESTQMEEWAEAICEIKVV